MLKPLSGGGGECLTASELITLRPALTLDRKMHRGGECAKPWDTRGCFPGTLTRLEDVGLKVVYGGVTWWPSEYGFRVVTAVAQVRSDLRTGTCYGCGQKKGSVISKPTGMWFHVLFKVKIQDIK